jgi:hypothetical protein
VLWLGAHGGRVSSGEGVLGIGCSLGKGLKVRFGSLRVVWHI